MTELERQVLLYIGEDPDSPDVFTEAGGGMAQIRDSITEATQEVVMLTGSHKSTFHLPLRKGSSFYRLRFQHGFLGWITDAWLVNEQRRLVQTDWKKLDHWDPRWLTMTGTPDQYVQCGLDIVGVMPRPSASSDVISLSCVVIPARISDQRDPVRLRRDFRYAVVQYAAAEYWASRGDAPSAAQAFRTYRELLGLRREQPRHADDEPRLGANKEPWPTETQMAPL